MRTKASKKLVREGRYIAEVEVLLLEDETGWSPYLSPVDMKKLDRVRLALRHGQFAEAAHEATVFELLPLAG